jgi:hypothetical protein
MFAGVDGFFRELLGLQTGKNGSSGGGDLPSALLKDPSEPG